MGDTLKRIPLWFILVGIVYVGALLTYGAFTGRAVEVFPPKISAKGEISGTSPKAGGLPWVTLSTTTPKFPMAECASRLPGVLAMASAGNVHRAQWGGPDLWFAEWQANTVWLSCEGSLIIVGAAGSKPDSTKQAVDALMDALSR